jgi:alpha-beta hydrolase superfamily lysophospholipase
MLRVLGLCGLLLLVARPATAFQKLDVPIRGRTITLAIYRCTATPRGTVLMGSGDVGWVGLATTEAEDLCQRGFVVAGINVRQYLSAFTEGRTHLSPADVQADYREIANALRSQSLLARPVIVSGVSEGAGLAVLAAADPANHAWLDGVITLGLPEVSELAWRWSDFTAWITKRDADEPSFRAHEVIGGVAPVPLAMIQSTKDEYVTRADYERLLASAGEPKKQILIASSNHRFTDRIQELQAAYASAVDWLITARGRSVLP